MSQKSYAEEKLAHDLTTLADWEMLSDQNKFDESYGEESNYGSEDGGSMEDVNLFTTGDDKDSSD